MSSRRLTTPEQRGSGSEAEAAGQRHQQEGGLSQASENRRELRKNPKKQA